MHHYFFNLFWITFFIHSVCFSHALVFVHIGPKLPPYLTTALQQARLFNSDCPIYLVAPEEALAALSSESDPQFHKVATESLQRCSYHHRFLYLTKLDQNSMDGFWLKTSERFFYLYELMEQYHLKDVFHLENDVMLYVDLQSLLPVFHKHYHNMIGATFDSDKRCIPGFVYISKPFPLHLFVRFMVEHAREGKNDMEILNAFRYKIFPRPPIDSLPIIFPQYALDYPLKNALGETVATPKVYMHHFEDFQSLFDAAALGQYLGGISPRNGEASPGFINETCIFNPSCLKIVWYVDQQERSVPYALYKNRAYRINNLHIHSKQLESFYSGNQG